MKRIGITQRVEFIKSYGERRDCLDQRWSELMYAIGYIPVPLPNVEPARVPLLVYSLGLDAILLSGGNSIVVTNPGADDVAPERDAFEASLLKFALSNSIPVLGICRGMQMINWYFGGKLTPVHRHIATRHRIFVQPSNFVLPSLVNSFHNWGIKKEDLPTELRPIAFDDNGFVEAFEAIDNRLLGLMWHPEREKPFNTLDIQLFKDFLL